MLRSFFLVSCSSLFFLISGCSTQPVRTSDADFVPADRMLTSSYSTGSSDTQLIVIKRDSGNKGLLCTSRLSVDGQPVADLKTSEKVNVYLKPGEHMLSIDLLGLSILCGKMNAETDINVVNGIEQEYRIGVTVNAELFIQKTGYR